MKRGRNAFVDTDPSEADIEAKSRRYCRAYGFDLIKLTAVLGDQDRILIGHPIAPTIEFIEFKKKGKRARDLQLERKLRRERMGYPCHVLDDYNAFVKLINQRVKKQKKRRRNQNNAKTT